MKMSRDADFCHRAVQAPCWGYPTETAYYRDAQSADAVVAIKIPFLAINAEDDPVHSFAVFITLGLLLTTSRYPAWRRYPTKSSNRIRILSFAAPTGADT